MGFTVNYDTKVDLITYPEVAAANKIIAADMNELKAAINNNARRQVIVVHNNGDGPLPDGYDLEYSEQGKLIINRDGIAGSQLNLPAIDGNADGTNPYAVQYGATYKIALITAQSVTIWAANHSPGAVIRMDIYEISTITGSGIGSYIELVAIEEGFWFATIKNGTWGT